ncbi:response regulator [alpha proteobacterium U9-1i]|nr:response regulator [alpha proteobacterium U9-1i]
MQTVPRQRVLVVEDEAVVAMLIEDMLADLGHEVAAIAGKLDHALTASRDLPLDLAILDVNLNGQRTYEVAEVLRSRGVPVIFATGYGAGGIDAAWRDAEVLQKPFQIEALSSAIATVVRPA